MRAMKRLRYKAMKKTVKLQDDKAQIEDDLLSYPENTYGAAWRVLALAVIDVKIELWRCL